MSADTTHVVVVGGGLTGLTAAHRLARTGREVTLVEASGATGGPLRTERAAGCLVEHGAEGFVARSTAVPTLAAEVGLGDALIEQSTLRSFGLRDGALRELEPGEAGAFLGLQVPPEDLGRGIRSFRDGMGSLADALARAITGRVRVVTAAPYRSVERTRTGARVHTARGSFDARHVVVATSARAAAELLDGAAGTRARALAAARTSSSVTVTLARSRAAVAHPLDATGFVVAPGQEEDGMRACTFVHAKFPHRAPAETALLRFLFRPAEGEIETLTDAAWIARAERAAARVLGARGTADHTWVSRWPNALPVHTPEHRGRVAALEDALAGTGILLAGSAFHGSGIDAAARSGIAAASAILAS